MLAGADLPSPSRRSRFFVKPGEHKGHRPAHRGDGVSRREVRAVAGLGDRERRALGRNGLDFEVGRVEAVVVVEAQPARLVADGDFHAVPDGFVMLEVARELTDHAAPPSAVSSAFGGRMMWFNRIDQPS